MKDTERQLSLINADGFENEVQEIKGHLNEVHSYKVVHQLMEKLKGNIKNYQNEFDQLHKEFDQLPDDIIDDDKRDEIRYLLYSPKTIKKAKQWLADIKARIDTRNRICFPKELTQYADEYLIGTGGFARVYKVKHIEKNQIVAVKIPIKNDESIGKAFLHELNNWVSLKHKNIVEVYQYNILPIPYIEMEWCDSCLENIKKPVQFNLACYYLYQIANGLEYAHKKHIAHCDLKPQNILLKHDIPKISDWGLSRLLTKQGTTTIGISLPFAAPEQFSIRYGEKDTRTDIWQLGILFYYLLTNDIPFSGNDFAEYGNTVLTTNINKMISKDKSLKEVAPILKHCLARQKDQRYKHAGEFLRDLKKIM